MITSIAALWSQIRDIYWLTLVISKGLDLVSSALKYYLGHRTPKNIFWTKKIFFVVTRLTVAQNRSSLALKSQFLAIIGLNKYLNMARNDSYV